MVPGASCLLEPVQALLQLTHPVLLPCHREALWLLHVDLLLEVSVEVGGLDVHVVELPVVVSHEGEEKSKGGVADDWSEGLVVVDALLLCVALGHVAHLVLHELAVCASLDLAHGLAPDGVSAGWSGDELVGPGLLQGVVLGLRSGLPLCAVCSR